MPPSSAVASWTTRDAAWRSDAEVSRARVLGTAITAADGTPVLDAKAVAAGAHALRVEAPGRVALTRSDRRVAFGASALPRFRSSLRAGSRPARGAPSP